MKYTKQTQVMHMPAYANDREVVEQREVAETVVRPSAAARLQQIIYTVYAAVAGLLLLRFVLVLLGANPSNGFAHFVYTVTQPLISPFQSLFSTNAITYGVARFEYASLIAVVVYGLVAWLIARLVGINREAARDETRL